MNRKLVRDKIPSIIANSTGHHPRVTVIEDDEKLSALLIEKLDEEAREVGEANDNQLPEEVADVIEVLMAICHNKKIQWSEVEEVRLAKLERAGGFSSGFVLQIGE